MKAAVKDAARTGPKRYKKVVTSPTPNKTGKTKRRRRRRRSQLHQLGRRLKQRSRRRNQRKLQRLQRLQRLHTNTKTVRTTARKLAPKTIEGHFPDVLKALSALGRVILSTCGLKLPSTRAKTQRDDEDEEEEADIEGSDGSKGSGTESLQEAIPKGKAALTRKVL